MLADKWTDAKQSFKDKDSFIFIFLLTFIYFTLLRELDARGQYQLLTMVNAGRNQTCIHPHVSLLPYRCPTDTKNNGVGPGNFRSIYALMEVHHSFFFKANLPCILWNISHYTDKGSIHGLDTTDGEYLVYLIWTLISRHHKYIQFSTQWKYN